MNKLIVFFLLLFVYGNVKSQTKFYDSQYIYKNKVAIGSQSLSSNPTDAWLMIGDSATNKGLMIPRITDTSHVSVPRQGMIIYSISDSSFYYRELRTWVKVIKDGQVQKAKSCGLSCSDCGVVSWTGTGLNFQASAADYNLNNIPYHFAGDSVTLDAADGSFARFDAIVLTSEGIDKITGTASSDPQLPQFDPCSDVLLTYVLVGAGETTPSQVTDQVIYDENAETWTHSTSGTISANFQSNVTAFHGDTSISVASWSNNANIKFTAPSVLSPNNYTNFSFWIKLSAIMVNNQNISIQFFNGTTAVSNQVVGQITKGNITTWQSVSFSMSQFTFTANTFDNIHFIFSGSQSNVTYMDWVRLQAGITQPTSSGGLSSAYTRMTDGTTTAVATGGDIFKFRTNTPLHATVASNDATHGDNVLIYADTSRALANSLATNGIVKKQIDSLAGTVGASTLQQVFNTETGGSVLTKTDTIQTKNFTLKINTDTASINPLYVSATTGDAIDAVSTSGYGINGQSTNVSGVYGASQNFHGVEGVANGSGNGINGTSISGVGGYFVILPSSTNTVVPVIVAERQSQGTGANGIGGSLQFKVQTDVTSQLSNEIISKWTNATNGSRSSQMTITGVGSASTNDIIYLEGDKRTRFNGRAQMQQGADVASVAGETTLGYDGNIFEITGTNAITLITGTDWQNGSEITLIFTSTASLTDGTANSGTGIGMELAGNANFNATADDTITLILCEIGGVQRWREKCRSVN